MSPPKWTAEHGNLLKGLRQKAGLDIATLARKYILSTTQVGQLENGGDSAFYNADIKYSTGKKLLQALGHDLPEAALTALAPTPQAAHITPPALPQSNLPSTPFSLSPQNFAWPLFILLIVLGLLGVYVEKSQTPDALPAEINADKPKIEPPSLESAATNLSAPTVVEATTSKSNCNWQTKVTEIQPTTPRKSAEYVHLVALQNVLVCIKDAEQRVATLELQAGDERSIYGPAPFSVYSANLPWVKVYFQGLVMKLPSDEVQQLKLSAASP